MENQKQTLSSETKVGSYEEKRGLKKRRHNPWLEKSKTNNFSTMSKTELGYLLRHYSLMKLACH